MPPETARSPRSGAGRTPSATGIGWASMTWLITGGAGYIGAHVARAMAEAGERVVALDDLSSGVADRLPPGIPLVQGSSLDGDLLKRVLAEHAVTGVVHLAARKQVGESVDEPTRYYQENVGGLADAAGGGRRGGRTALRLLLVGRRLRQPRRGSRSRRTPPAPR